MTPMPDLATVVARLEKENRNLIARVEHLERRRGAAFAALLGNVLLLVCAGLLVGYLGLYPRGVDRLPLQARTVDTEEVRFRAPDGTPRARLWADEKGVHVVDASGKAVHSRP